MTTLHRIRCALAAVDRKICPVCKKRAQLATIIAVQGQCVTCTARIIGAHEHAAEVLKDNDLGLQFRATWACNILAGARSPRPVISLSRRPLPTSREMAGAR